MTIALTFHCWYRPHLDVTRHDWTVVLGWLTLSLLRDDVEIAFADLVNYPDDDDDVYDPVCDCGECYQGPCDFICARCLEG